MADAPLELREIPYLRLFPWVRLFRGVGVAFDPKKILLAALGLGLLLAGWGILDYQVFPDTGEFTLRYSREALPSLFDAHDGVRGTLAKAAAIVADPALALAAPFVAMLSPFEPMIGSFWHGLFSALWAAIVWGIFGGAIARIAIVELATGERISITTALRFAVQKAVPLISAPLCPFIGVAFFAVLCTIMGVFYHIPSPFFRVILGLLVFLPLLAGLVMSIILLGLSAGWPLMHATVAAEGEDAFDALSRSYAYVYQRPGRYAAYAALAWALGTVGAIVVGIFAHAVASLAIWGLSFGAPDQLLVTLFRGRHDEANAYAVAIHTGWLTVVGLLAYGWVYSYFWTTASIIYLLLRHDVDGTDWNDISLATPEAQPFAVPPQPSTAQPPTAPPSAPSPDAPASGPADPATGGTP